MLAEAKVLFDKMPVKDQVSWNTIISCYAQNDDLEEVRNYCTHGSKAQKRDKWIIPFLLFGEFGAYNP
ncbi:hypothetical protein KY290_019084 [Solanum tuberosum]|uniref:Pentatricopeptide repeat-containing protein n=1 Tax=Solanum tuberosum TaxID=4113 RepID=A0ABQ7VHV1_SOLTU|nr:hypothetical protein KY290_019084 [Solanum tuberosum]